MNPRLIEAYYKVEELSSQVAVMRGPLVYCLESPDLPEGVRANEVRIPRDIVLTACYDHGLLE